MKPNPGEYNVVIPEDHQRIGETIGTYLNLGKAAFEEAVNSEISVDKTDALHQSEDQRS